MAARLLIDGLSPIGQVRRDLPAPLATLINECAARNPDHRPHSAAVLRALWGPTVAAPPSLESVDAWCEELQTRWGEAVFIEAMASRADDEAFRCWWRGCSARDHRQRRGGAGARRRGGRPALHLASDQRADPAGASRWRPGRRRRRHRRDGRRHRRRDLDLGRQPRAPGHDHGGAQQR